MNHVVGAASGKAGAQEVLAQAALGKMDLLELIAAAEGIVALGRRADAIRLYQTWIKHTPSPFAYAVWFNLGVLIADGGDHAGAEAAYRASIKLKPDFVESHLNLGSQLEAQGKKEEAVAVWRGVVEGGWCRPDTQRAHYLHALNHMGRVLESIKQFKPAEEVLARSLEIDPTQLDPLQHWIHLRQKQCSWPAYGTLPGVSQNTQLLATSPLAMLSEADDPALQLLAARAFAERKLKYNEPFLAEGKRYRHDRLRIGYLSGDLCTHAVGLLLADLFEQHDRTKIETFAFCSSPEDGSPYRQRLISSLEQFERVGRLSDADVAQRIAACEIDVLVDLHGLSSGTRIGVLARRPAPVQLTYLGFIGPTALPWIDYVISDAYALPESLERFYAEKVLRLPYAFLPCDRKRTVKPAPDRSACGLPPEAFVFASFNNSYKLNPDMFALWMSILREVEGSVLWLLDDNPWATENLIRFAARHGVARERLVFAPRVGVDDYLARFGAADVFLDNHPYNAGSTAQDALWAGLPMLTLSGKTFVSRMVGSLLTALDLPELIATCHEEYRARAVALARDPSQLARIRQKLIESRSGPVFDMGRFARDLEALYLQVVTQ